MTTTAPAGSRSSTSAIAGWDGLDRFTERAANHGSLGIFPAKYLIRLMQAHARRLDKFGA